VRNLGCFAKNEVRRDELTRLIAGSAELDQLAHEIERPAS
jgi:simple sugar transport system ATP-binding protein